jgi:hypothetical protein
MVGVADDAAHVAATSPVRQCCPAARRSGPSRTCADASTSRPFSTGPSGE